MMLLKSTALEVCLSLLDKLRQRLRLLLTETYTTAMTAEMPRADVILAKNVDMHWIPQNS